METFFRDEWVEAWFALMCEVWAKNATPEALKYTKNPMRFLTKNKNVTMDFIDKHPEIEWNWFGIHENPNLTMDYILAHPEIKWFWQVIAKHPNITMEMILANPNLRKCYVEVVANPNITMEMLKNYEYFKECDFDDIPFNADTDADLTLIYQQSVVRDDSIETTMLPNLFVSDLLYNPNLSIDDVFDLFPNKNNTEYLTRNPYRLNRAKCLNIAFMLKHPEIVWDYREIFANTDIGQNATDDEMRQLSTRNNELDLNLYESLRNIKCSKYCRICEIFQMFDNKEITHICACIFANEHLGLNFVKDNQHVCWKHDFLYTNEMKHTKNNYIESQIAHICISTMYEQMCNTVCKNNIERVFADEYIVSRICNY
jgi:hypothetical protein